MHPLLILHNLQIELTLIHQQILQSQTYIPMSRLTNIKLMLYILKLALNFFLLRFDLRLDEYMHEETVIELVWISLDEEGLEIGIMFVVVEGCDLEYTASVVVDSCAYEPLGCVFDYYESNHAVFCGWLLVHIFV